MNCLLGDIDILAAYIVRADEETSKLAGLERVRLHSLLKKSRFVSGYAFRHTASC
jgi:hypothetical protein